LFFFFLFLFATIKVNKAVHIPILMQQQFI